MAPHAAIIERALAEGREWLNEAEAKALLAAYGIPVVPTRATAADPDAAAPPRARSASRWR